MLISPMRRLCGMGALDARSMARQKQKTMVSLVSLLSSYIFLQVLAIPHHPGVASLIWRQCFDNKFA